ncbi:MAG: hypothetical protein PHY45_10205 [Rhodocyclaceae bacterium]|nr:hypothetical protein [Rhodocyclaceae bacterium]
MFILQPPRRCRHLEALFPQRESAMEFAWFFYWIIAAIVLAPIVLIVKGLTADKGKKKRH